MRKLDPIELTKELIRFESVSPAGHDINNFLAGLLSELGFECHKLVYEGTANLYAKRQGAGKNLCFLGHSDVVPAGRLEDWHYPPFGAQLIDGKIYGRGAVDMKGAIAAFLAAASNYPEAPISILISGNEESDATNGIIKTIEWLKNRNENIDHCLIGEPTNPSKIGEVIKIGRRGSLNLRLTVAGKQGHVAYPEYADNPVPKLAKIVSMLSDIVLDAGNEQFPPSNLEFTRLFVDNQQNNIIPAYAEAGLNIRYNNMHASDFLVDLIKVECSKYSDSFKLEVLSNSEAFLTNSPEFQQIVYDSVVKVTGHHPELSTTGGTSDGRFMKELCPCIEFGLVNKTAHKVDEYVSVDDITKLTKVYDEIIKHYYNTKFQIK